MHSFPLCVTKTPSCVYAFLLELIVNGNLGVDKLQNQSHIIRIIKLEDL